MQWRGCLSLALFPENEAKPELLVTYSRLWICGLKSIAVKDSMVPVPLNTTYKCWRQLTVQKLLTCNVWNISWYNSRTETLIWRIADYLSVNDFESDWSHKTMFYLIHWLFMYTHACTLLGLVQTGYECLYVTYVTCAHLCYTWQRLKKCKRM